MSDPRRTLARLEALLSAGLATDWSTRPDTSEQLAELSRRLRDIDAKNLISKLVIAGFRLEPYADPKGMADTLRSCATCSHFEWQNQFCSLPELSLPVEPHWSCSLWRA